MIKLLVVFFFATFFRLVSPQIYEVDCETQHSTAYRVGTEAGKAAAKILLGTVPRATIRKPTGLGSIVGGSVNAVLSVLWPMLIGRNSHCIEDAMTGAFLESETSLNIQLSNYTLEKRKRFFDGMTNLAAKANEWIPIVKDAQLDKQIRDTANDEYFDMLSFMYLRANEERNTFLESSTTTAELPSLEQAFEFFLFARELAFLQIGVGVDMAANSKVSSFAKEKLVKDLREDAWFYLATGHAAVEKIVRCLPNNRMAAARAILSNHLNPMYQFVTRIAFDDTNVNYHRKMFYKPVESGDYIALRLNDGHFAAFEAIFKKPVPTPQSPHKDSSNTCPRCGWGLFDKRFSPNTSLESVAWRCRDYVLYITNLDKPGTPILTCQYVTISFREGALQIPAIKDMATNPPFIVTGVNETASGGETKCGEFVLDRDHIKLTPVNDWINELSIIDAIIVKAN